MMITLKNFVILLGFLLFTCGALSYAMENNSPPGQLAAKDVKDEDSQFNKLPFEVVHYMTEFLNEADFLHLMQTNTSFNDKLCVLLFKNIKSAACKGCWKVPRRDLMYYIRSGLALPPSVFFNVVSQSDVDELKLALSLQVYLNNENDENKVNYLEWKKYSLAVAMQNNFTEGVAILQNEFKFNITPKECQELIGNLKFPLTEDLLVAAIHLISHLELTELLNGQDVDFDPSLNDDVILNALIYAVHHRKMDHIKVIFNCPYIKSYFLPENYCRLYPYIDYSCKNFDDTSFVKFLIEKQPTKTGEFVMMFWNCFRDHRRLDALFNLYAAAPEYFQTFFNHYFVSASHLLWQVKPEELFVMLQDCSLEILPSISAASWKQFVSTPYNNGAVKCVIDTYSHEENLSVSARTYWEEIATKFDADCKSLDKDLSLENETFLLVFIKSLSSQYSRFVRFVDFLNDKPFLSKFMRNNILTHFRGLQDQSYLGYLERIGFVSSCCIIL